MSKEESPVQTKISAHEKEGKGYWLMKSEPDQYSLDDLKKDKETPWDGIRNYQARNFMMNHMKVGDHVLFYHSNATPPGVAGLAQVSKLAEPDIEAFNKKSPYYDPKSTEEKPRWFSVKVKFRKTFKEFVPLDVIRESKALQSMLVIRRGQRLSIQPVTRQEFEGICKLGGVEPPT